MTDFKSLDYPTLKQIDTILQGPGVVVQTLQYKVSNDPWLQTYLTITDLNIICEMVVTLFYNTIPYNTVPNMTIDQASLFMNQLANQILSYFRLYAPNIQTYVLTMSKIKALQDMINAKQTYTRHEGETTQNQNQDTSLNTESFNPITLQTNLDVPSLQPANLGSLQPNSSVKELPESANYTTGTKATNFNEDKNRNYTEFTLQQLTMLQDQARNALKPLFRKIGTLFWILSDDYNGNGYLGFNLW